MQNKFNYIPVTYNLQPSYKLITAQLQSSYNPVTVCQFTVLCYRIMYFSAVRFELNFVFSLMHMYMYTGRTQRIIIFCNSALRFIFTSIHTFYSDFLMLADSMMHF